MMRFSGMFWLLCLLLSLMACMPPVQAERGENAALDPLHLAPDSPNLDPLFAASVPLVVTNKEARRYEIHFVDPGSGETVPGIEPISLGRSVFFPPEPRSSDGAHVAAIESYGNICEPYAGGSACRPSVDLLHLVDLQARRQVTVSLKTEGWLGPIAFHPDTTLLAMAQNRSASTLLAMYAVDSGALVAQRELGFPASQLFYVQNGKALAVFGQLPGSPPGLGRPQPARLVVVDATTLDVLWELTLDELATGDWCLARCSEPHGDQEFVDLRPALVPTQDGRLLYIVHADEARLTTVDFAAQAVRTVEIGEKISWLERLLTLTASVAKAKGPMHSVTKIGALGPDGKHLYVVGQELTPIYDAEDVWQGMQSHIDLQMLDAVSGRVVAARDLAVPEVWVSLEELAFVLDGRRLLLNAMNMSDGMQWVEVFEAQNLEPVTRLEWRVLPVSRIDGSPILMASRWRGSGLRMVELAEVNPQSFSIVEPWTMDISAFWLMP